MKLQQLRYLVEVARNGLVISDTAKTLFTSQPGVSHHIRELERELSSDVFVRRGKRIVALTRVGREVLSIAERIIADTENLKRIAHESQQEPNGSLVIAATHTQALYALPTAVSTFVAMYPKLHLSIRACNPLEAVSLVQRGEADICVSSEIVASARDLVMIPGDRWSRCVIARSGHPLLKARPLSFEAIQRYPLITHDFAFHKSSVLRKAFDQGFTPRVLLTSDNTAIIKTYVLAGLGVGLVSSLAFNGRRDRGLRILDADHLFGPGMTALGIRRDNYIPGYMYDLIKLLVPYADRRRVDELRGKEAA
ncbi:MAG: LysR family transcriptional regulator [Burkholderiales bacterium]|nr:LysR family transcriptional regulator [Burkholderiales bacterium]OJX09402.1 MAG: hypothetical protein BGO72_06550 [Burkholderiales bacterium 70-64]